MAKSWKKPPAGQASAPKLTEIYPWLGNPDHMKFRLRHLLTVHGGFLLDDEAPEVKALVKRMKREAVNDVLVFINATEFIWQRIEFYAGSKPVKATDGKATAKPKETKKEAEARRIAKAAEKARALPMPMFDASEFTATEAKKEY